MQFGSAPVSGRFRLCAQLDIDVVVEVLS